MTNLVEEPRLSVDSIRLLHKFQSSLRSRVYNLVEDYVRDSGNSTITPEVLEKCLRRAVEEILDGDRQRKLFDG